MAIRARLCHALGLKHGHQPINEFGNGAPVLPFNSDSMEFSVMTYRSYVGSDALAVYNETWGYAQTFMMYDIRALQHFYGAGFTANAGNTTYSWSPTGGETYIDGSLALDPGGNRIFMTIWDGNGIDTYDLSNYATNLNISLEAGGYSTFSSVQRAYLGGGPNGGYARGNVFNALQYNGDVRSLIENAKDGSGNDSIRGNQAANRLDGNAGNDTLRGLANNDTLCGGAGKDVQIGGGGFDLFLFLTAAESAYGANRDILRQGDGGQAFDGAGSAAGDRIDLSAIYAGTLSFGSRVKLFNVGSHSMVRANTDGDAAWEFELQIEDGARLASAYSAADFYL